MNKELFKKICINFGKDANKELYDLWNEQLEDYAPYYLELAINNIIAKDKYFPTLSRVIEELKNLPSIEIPAEEKTRRMKEKGIEPKWLNKKIVNQPIDEETKKEYEEFQEFIKEFRDGEYD